MAWIKFEKDLLTDPRVLRIARTLQARWKLYEVTVSSAEMEIGNDEALPAVTLVCGALVRIWSLADTHLGADDLLPLGIGELDEVVGIPGFCALLPGDWLQPIDDNTVKLPDFHAHNGTEAKKKAVTQKRVARHRQALHGRNAQALPDQTRPDQTKTKEKSNVGLKPDVASVAKQKNGELRKAAAEVIGFLNAKAGRTFDTNGANADHVIARLRDGETLGDLRAVIALKCREWKSDEKMADYLRPETLFNRTKFASYKGKLGEPNRPDEA